jgi:CHAD domain-containing protein
MKNPAAPAPRENPPGGKAAARPHGPDDGPHPAGEVVELLGAALRDGLEALREHGCGIRDGDDPEAVHQARVAVRRMRAALRLGRPYLRPDWRAGLDGELKWLGGVLGPLRDADVFVIGLRADAATLGKRDRIAALGIAERFEHGRELSRQAARRELRGDRYHELLQRLAVALREPLPLLAADPAVPHTVGAQVAAVYAGLDRAVRKLPDTPHDEQLHRIRILAKRLRYAAELGGPGLGKRGPKLARAAKRLQTVLGDHHDAVVTRGIVIGALDRDTATRTAFVAGRLVERAETRRALIVRQWWGSWRPVVKQGTRLARR